MSFSGRFGTVECEVILNGAFHSRSMTKVIGGLIGYITAANASRCSRGGATMLRETLPWHIRYDWFSGTLPNITAIGTRVIGLSFRMREPTFGATCLARSEPSWWALLEFFRITESGELVWAIVGGSIPCRGAIETVSSLSGETGVSGINALRITVTLI
jgi:hypothetical protein